MSTRTKNLIIGGGVLLLLTVILVVLILTGNSNQDTLSSSNSSGLEIELINKPIDDVIKVNIENDLDSYEINKNEDNEWYVSSLNGFPQLSSTYTEVIEKSSVVSALRIVENASSDLSRYGLSDPQSIISTSFSDNTTFTLMIGNIVSDKTGYYAKRDDNDTIYIIKAENVTSFMQSSLQFINKEIVSKSSDGTTPDVKELSIVRQDLDSPIVLTKNPKVESSNNSQDTSKIVNNYLFTSPATVFAEDILVESVILGIFGLYASNTVAVNPSSNQISEYQLDQPTSKITVLTDDRNYVLKIGKGILSDHSDDEPSNMHDHIIDRYYVMLDGLNIVYEVSADALPWIEFDYKKAISSNIISPFIDNLKQIIININDQSYTADLEGTGDDLKVIINGNLIDTDKYRIFYQNLLSTPILEITNDNPTSNTKMEIKFKYRNENYSDDTLEFKEYSQRKMGAVLNQSTYFVVNREYVEMLIQDTEKISKNQDITS